MSTNIRDFLSNIAKKVSFKATTPPKRIINYIESLSAYIKFIEMDETSDFYEKYHNPQDYVFETTIPYPSLMNLLHEKIWNVFITFKDNLPSIIESNGKYRVLIQLFNIDDDAKREERKNLFNWYGKVLPEGKTKQVKEFHDFLRQLVEEGYENADTNYFEQLKRFFYYPYPISLNARFVFWDIISNIGDTLFGDDNYQNALVDMTRFIVQEFNRVTNNFTSDISNIDFFFDKYMQFLNDLIYEQAITEKYCHPEYNNELWCELQEIFTQNIVQFAQISIHYPFFNLSTRIATAYREGKYLGNLEDALYWIQSSDAEILIGKELKENQIKKINEKQFLIKDLSQISFEDLKDKMESRFNIVVYHYPELNENAKINPKKYNIILIVPDTDMGSLFDFWEINNPKIDPRLLYYIHESNAILTILKKNLMRFFISNHLELTPDINLVQKQDYLSGKMFVLKSLFDMLDEPEFTKHACIKEFLHINKNVAKQSSALLIDNRLSRPSDDIEPIPIFLNYDENKHQNEPYPTFLRDFAIKYNIAIISIWNVKNPIRSYFIFINRWMQDKLQLPSNLQQIKGIAYLEEPDWVIAFYNL